MRRIPLAFAFLSVCATLLAQGADSAPHATASDSAPVSAKTFEFKDDAGSTYFSYTYPSNWEVLDSKPMMPAVRLRVEEGAKSETEKKGVECTQLALLLRNPAANSSIVVIALPYECLGASVINENDLPGAAMGVSEGMKKNFDITDPIYGAYKSGKHNFWIERAHAVSKSHPDSAFTLETACTMLKKAMVCWVSFAHDENALNVLESGKTSLDGEPSVALVPPTAFASRAK